MLHVLLLSSSKILSSFLYVHSSWGGALKKTVVIIQRWFREEVLEDEAVLPACARVGSSGSLVSYRRWFKNYRKFYVIFSCVGCCSVTILWRGSQLHRGTKNTKRIRQGKVAWCRNDACKATREANFLLLWASFARISNESHQHPPAPHKGEVTFVGSRSDRKPEKRNPCHATKTECKRNSNTLQSDIVKQLYR